MKNLNQSRIEKIKALAIRGVDGEKTSAIAILKKLLGEDITVDTWEPAPTGKKEINTYTFARKNTPHDIRIPYREFVKSARIWRKCGDKARAIIQEITGDITVQNWEDKITCCCSWIDVADIQKVVNAGVYGLLCGLGIPVIHNGGDKAGFGVHNDCMEDGTAFSIFQYQVCTQYEAPNRAAEIYAAMRMPQYNKFVAVTEDNRVWGKITNYDTVAGIVTLTPLNPAYEPVVLHVDDILHLYRVESHPRWYAVKDDEKETLAAAKVRAAKVITD